MISHPSKPIFRLTLSFFAGEIVFSDLKNENIVELNSSNYSPPPPHPNQFPPYETCPGSGWEGWDSWSGQMSAGKWKGGEWAFMAGTMPETQISGSAHWAPAVWPWESPFLSLGSHHLNQKMRIMSKETSRAKHLHVLNPLLVELWV